MRVWITLGLIAVAIGCNGKYEGTHAATGPAMNHGGQGMPSKDSSAPSGDGGHESASIKAPTQRKLVVEHKGGESKCGATAMTQIPETIRAHDAADRLDKVMI